MLPVSTTAGVATATAAAMEAAAATAESAASRGSRTSSSATRYARPCSATVGWACSTGVSTSSAGIPATSPVSNSAATVCVSATTVAVSAASISVAATTVPAPTVPRADAEEDAAIEPLRTIKAVRSAGVGVIRVIAPLTYRGTIFRRGDCNFGANSNPDSHLGLCCRCRERQSQKQCEQNRAKSLHKSSSCCPVLFFLGSGAGVQLRPQHLPAFGLLTPPASDLSNNVLLD